MNKLNSKETCFWVGGGKRVSNLELYRIICMMLIVAHHCVVNSGLISAGSALGARQSMKKARLPMTGSKTMKPSMRDLSPIACFLKNGRGASGFAMNMSTPSTQTRVR